MSTQIKSECDYRVIRLKITRKSVLWWPGAIIALKCINQKCRNAYYEAPTRIMLAVEYYKKLVEFCPRGRLWTDSWCGYFNSTFAYWLGQFRLHVYVVRTSVSRRVSQDSSQKVRCCGMAMPCVSEWKSAGQTTDQHCSDIMLLISISHRDRPSGCVPLLCQCATNIKCGKKWANHFRIRANKKSAVKFCVSKRARKNNQEEPAHWWAAETLWRMMSRGRWLVGLNATRARRFLWPTSWIAPKLDEKFLAVQFCTQKEPSPNMRPMWVVSYQRI